MVGFQGGGGGSWRAFGDGGWGRIMNERFVDSSEPDDEGKRVTVRIDCIVKNK